MFDRFVVGFTIASNTFIMALLKMKKIWLEFTSQSKEADKVSEKIRSMERENAQATLKIIQANQKVLSEINKVKNALKAVNAEIREGEKLADDLMGIMQHNRIKQAQLSLKIAAYEAKIAELGRKAKEEKDLLKRKQMYLEAYAIYADNQKRSLELLDERITKEADLYMTTEKYGELLKKGKEGTITPKDVGLSNTNDEKFVEFTDLFKERFRVEQEYEDKRRGLARERLSADKEAAAVAKEVAKERASAAEQTIEAATEEQVYHLKNDNSAKTLEDQLKFEDEMRQKQQSLLDRNFQAKKLSKEEHELASLKLDKDSKEKKVKLAIRLYRQGA